jgi:hypothetical protein
MPAKPFVIETRSFPRKQDAVEYFRSMLHRYTPPDRRWTPELIVGLSETPVYSISEIPCYGSLSRTKPEAMFIRGMATPSCMGPRAANVETERERSTEAPTLSIPPRSNLPIRRARAMFWGHSGGGANPSAGCSSIARRTTTERSDPHGGRSRYHNTPTG